MKKILLLILSVVVSTRMQAQQPGATPPSAVPGNSFSERVRQIQNANGQQVDPSAVTKFNLDFPGGKPKELVAAIQKASGHSLNAIVPDEFADIKLPPLKMNGVDVDQLFHALELASMKTETYVSGTTYFGGLSPAQNYQQRVTSYGFRTDGKITDDSIWYFHVDKTPTPPENPPQKTCRFYALAPYLDAGLKVDDITTAVETAWKMSGEKAPPAISFHKDTKLLIAVGEPEKLQIIDSILQALRPATAPKPQTIPAPSARKSSEVKTDE